MTYIPSKRLIYAVLFGNTHRQINSILERLSYAEHAVIEPFTLINTFVQLEKVFRFEQVERHTDAMADLIKNFQLNVTSAAAAKVLPGPAHEDDPRDLVGLCAEVTSLRNGLVSWTREIERFGARAVGDFGATVGGNPGLPLLDAREYLERTADEYGAMVRKCEGLLGQVSMTFQMVG